MLSTSSINGVFLKGVRFHVQGLSGAWAEGRFKVYTGGAGFTSPIDGNRYDDASNTTALPYDAGSQLILSSSGTEDFFDSSYNWINDNQYTSSAEAGLLYNSAGFGKANAGNSVVSLYRFFGENGASLPSAGPDTNLVFSWSCGDPRTAPSGNCNIVGDVFYYA